MCAFNLRQRKPNSDGSSAQQWCISVRALHCLLGDELTRGLLLVGVSNCFFFKLQLSIGRVQCCSC